MSHDTHNYLQLFNFWTAFHAAGKVLTGDNSKLLNKFRAKAEEILKKSSKDISYQDLAEAFRLVYELLRKIDDADALAVAKDLGVQLYNLLRSFLEDDRKKLLVRYAFKRETLNSVIIEGAIYFQPVLDALPHEEPKISELNDKSLKFLTLIATNCIQNAQQKKNEFPIEIDTGDNLAIDLLNSIGTLVLVVALLILAIEVAAGGSLVISIGALSLAIEHVIAGMLITSASCYTASAGVHYVYELPLEKEPLIYQNDNSLRIKC